MRADELMVISVAEYQELKAKAEKAAKTSQLFDAEEMQAIREQYVERVEAAEARRDELEWKLRVELAKIRDAELHSRRAADDLRRIEESLAALLVEDEDPTAVRSTVPSAGVQSLPPRPQAKVTLTPPPKAVPPPLPPLPPASAVTLPPVNPVPPRTNGNGSHAETFARAMANRKRYSA